MRTVKVDGVELTEEQVVRAYKSLNPCIAPVPVFHCGEILKHLEYDGKWLVIGSNADDLANGYNGCLTVTNGKETHTWSLWKSITRMGVL